MSPEAARYQCGQRLSRLPGHHNPDSRMRYDVLRLALDPSDWFDVHYREGSGRDVIRRVQLQAVLHSLDDTEKFYIAARDADGPVNFFFQGVRGITRFDDGQCFDMKTGLDALFERGSA